MRRDFLLPKDDTDHLDAMGYQWETVVSGGQWILIHEFAIPPGYNLAKITLAIQITAGYPAAPLDMVYVFPNLERSDGKPIGALSPHNLDGKTYQRWSRHRSQENQWRPGIDSLCTHISLSQDWFAREFSKE